MELLIEVGCEEIPARFIRPALTALEEGFRLSLTEHRLDGGGQVVIRTQGTPRRLVLAASGLPERQTDVDEEVLGPRVEAAYDAAGNPTPACLGFARGKGVEVSQLHKVESPRGWMVALRRHLTGQPTREVLQGVFPDLLAKLPFPKVMRWGEGVFQFARPVHWILALLGNQVIPFAFAGAESGRLSRGHRFTAPAPFEVTDADTYAASLRARDVVVDPEERRRLFKADALRLAEEAGGALIEDGALEDEIVYLIEKPNPLLGRFDEKFLALPGEVLIAAMRNHQRYFAIEQKGGGLLNAFVAVGNTPVPDPAVVRRGYERVLTARLSDASFFFDADREQALIDRVSRLDQMTFQADLGSYYEKSHRVGNLAVAIGCQLNLGDWNSPARLIDALTIKLEDVVPPREKFSWIVARASLLAKADLLTEMVGEFPELQGIMGGHYALASGEHARTAQAIREQYQPRFAQDALPSTDEGAVLSMADRIDTLAGCFGVGLRPTGATDPYALRRQCLGVIAVVLGRGYHLPLRWVLKQAVAGVAGKVEACLLRRAQDKERKEAARKKREARPPTAVPPFEDKLVDDLFEFFAGRLRQRFGEDTAADVVDAVLAAGMDDMLDAQLRVRALDHFARQSAFADLGVAFKRVANIIKDFEGAALAPALFIEAEERELHKVFQAVAPVFEQRITAREFAGALDLLAQELRGPVDRFFEKVLVNDPNDPARQTNRKALLAQIASLFGRVADFTRLQVKETR